MRMLSLTRELRPPVRAMAYLHWIFSLVGSLTSVFVHIYLYQRFGSVSLNVLTQTVFFVGCAAGFCGVGAYFGAKRIDLKRGYVLAILVYGASFLLLIGDVGEPIAYIFMLLNGFGFGIYWLTLHTFELTETRDVERDRYSSVISAGDQIVSMVGPALATALFFISGNVLNIGTYTLLFVVAPLASFCGFLFLRDIRSYIPEPIEWADVVHFATEKKNVIAQVYFFANSSSFSFSRLSIPIASLVFFGSEMAVGLWNTLFAAIAIVALLLLSRVRHSGNRLRFLAATSLVGAALAFFVAARYDMFAFMVYSLLNIVVKPLDRVSGHVIDLATMETLGRKERDFFPTMVLRDLALCIWRVIALLLFALIISFVGEGEVAVRLGFLAIAAAMVLQWIGGSLVYRGR
jgi:MFS family permease